MKVKPFLLAIPVVFVAACSSAPPGVRNNIVVPGQEREIAQNIAAEGPTETKLIESIEVLSSIPLEDEFVDLEGRVLRAREITILPGGQVAVHQHESRPGIAYVLEGELIEHRNDESNPVTRGVGAVASEKTGIVHWWANKSSRKAKVLVVDIVSQGT